MGLSQLLYFVVQLGGSVVVARLLRPYEVGIYAVALAVVGILNTLQAVGMNAFAVREPNLTPHLRASAFTINAVICVFLAALIFASSGLAGAFLRDPGVMRVMRLLALMPLLTIFEFLPAALLERNANFKAISLVQSAQIVVNQSLTIVLALHGFSYMSMAYGSLASSVFGVLAYNVLGREHVSLAVGLREWRRIAGFGLNMLAISGVNTISARVSEFVLGRVVGLAALGLYSRASNINNIAWVNIHLLIGRVVFVDMANNRRAGQSLRQSYVKIVHILTTVLWPVFAGLAILAGPFIRLVYGPHWVAATGPLVMLAISAMILVSITMTWEVFVLCGETDRQARFEFLRTGFGVVLFIAGCFGGLIYAAAARIGEAVFSFFLYRPHLYRMTDTRFDDFVPVYCESAFLTLAAVAPAALVMTQHAWADTTPLPVVFCAIALGGAQWLTGLFALDHPLADELLGLWRGLRSRLLPAAS